MNIAMFKNFRSDERGTITIEFVVVLPLLLFLFIGTIVFFDAYKSRALADSAAYTIADIVSRKEKIDVDALNELLVLQAALLPKTSDDRWMRFTSIVYDADEDSYSVVWSKTSGAIETVLEDDDIPLEKLPLMYDSETVILVDSYVPYVPIADWVGISAKTFETRVAISPRFFGEIKYIEGDGTEIGVGSSSAGS